ncbi:MAG TPA: BTAD domain-containing putative transcriptional regulator, partial [Gemmatimonadaceae bacterium]|nr:BTAD domain-containing putative transcriptional regulator [Gemmatimonadaceae bacterium]
MYVGGESGTPMGGAAAQRRLLALLAVLAVAGEAGLSREKLLALLWPETEPEKARHALTQSLYHARRALRCDDLFVAGGDIRLNRERIDSDVQEFERALAAGELDRAAAAYQGPFLDGFFLSGSAEFEQWATAQRSRLAQRMAAALERLAARAEERADHRHAVEWRRRAVTLDPLDSGATVRLMQALAAAGDRAGALQHARVHELLLRDSLDVAPDPAVSALAARLRHDAEHAAASPPSGTPVVAPRAAPDATAAEERGHTAVIAPARDTPARDTPEALPAVAPEPAPEAAVPEAAAPEAAAPEAARPRRASWRHGWRAAALMVLLLAVVGGAVALARMRLGTGAQRPAPQAVVVAPFRIAGADPSLAYLREGMVELLSTRLADDTAARAVDPGAVLTAWRAAGFTSALDVPRDSAVRVAAQFAAAHVVVGSVVGSPSKMVVTASLVAVPSGEVQAQATVEGPADSLTTVIDRLAARLIAAEAGEGERFLSHVTPSLAALRAYLDGRAAYRRGSFATAARAYERALQLDSTFALAALHLAVTADRLNDAARHDRALALAWAARDDLRASDQAHLIAFAGPSYPAPSTEGEQLAAWERAVALAPERAEVWEELGERFFYDGAMLGMADARERASAAFRRALELDPTYVPARRFLVLLAARDGDLEALERLATPETMRDSLGALAPFLRWRVAVAQGDERAERQARALLGRYDDANLRMLALASQFDAVNLEDGERALHILHTRAARATDVLDVLLGQHSLALNEGRPALALALTSQL